MIKLKDYDGKRWFVEQSISEKIEFFHLNKLGSSIIIKVDFYLTMTLLADVAYKIFARQIDGFSNKKAKTIYQNFIRNYSRFEIDEKTKTINVPLNKKSHFPLIIDLDWFKKETEIT